MTTTELQAIANNQPFTAWWQDTYQPPYYPTIPTGGYGAPWVVSQPAQECSGDVHVFPCPHCDRCKCGAATVKRQKAKK